MAPRKNAKKQPEAPKVNIGAEIFASLRALALARLRLFCFRLKRL